jgi:hypothetical protein
MRREQRRGSARGWIQSGARVTVKAYAKRYGVDKYTAYDDLTAIGYSLPASADQWARRPPPPPPAKGLADDAGDDGWIALDGRQFFVVGYTPGGAPYGVFDDEVFSCACDEFACVCDDWRPATMVARCGGAFPAAPSESQSAVCWPTAR